MNAFSRILNPHFVANILSAIQSHVYMGQVPEAMHLISSFGQFYQFAHIHQARSSSPLQEDLDLGLQYLALEKMRFGDKLEVHQHIRPFMPAHKQPQVPPLITSCFIDYLLHLPLLSKTPHKTLSLYLEPFAEAWRLSAEILVPGDSAFSPRDKSAEQSYTWIADYLDGFQQSTADLSYSFMLKTDFTPAPGSFIITLLINPT